MVFRPASPHSPGMPRQKDIKVLFGRRVRALREAAGWSQDKFAAELGVDRSHYGALERGEANATLETVARIAAGLGVRPKDLFEFD